MPADSFADLPVTAPNHFKLHFYGSVIEILRRAAEAVGGREKALEHYPFLAAYASELARIGPPTLGLGDAIEQWDRSLAEWEGTARGHLPLRALAEAARLDAAAIRVLILAGAVEEDTRLGFVFDDLQGTTSHRPVAGLLDAWAGSGAADRPAVEQLRWAGVLDVVESELPRASRAVRVPATIWDAVRGYAAGALAAWARYRPTDESTPLSEFIAPDEIKRQAATIAALLKAGDAGAAIVRGPQHNGRRTLARAIARELGRGALEIDGLTHPDDDRWRLVGPLAALLDAMPIIAREVGPGETFEIPALSPRAPACVVLGKSGGIGGPLAEQAVTVALDIPAARERRAHWMAAGVGAGPVLDAAAERFRITSGNVRRAGRLAISNAAAAGATVSLRHVREAMRILNGQALDKFAKRIEASGGWEMLSVAEKTSTELLNLERRCRHRERLRSVVGPGVAENLTAGVRALFTGPSGTGKTLAARVLACALGMDLYRLDLSTVVNKYIGETEKHLDQLFSRAEELDVVLLLDEGDALMTQRTNVQSSNDRYANLETNYLLQRLDTFEGILLVTTNAAGRIDTAFQRRMDVVVQFRLPEPAERYSIWTLHLPEDHDVADDRLREIADKCGMSGAQIRNAALHAAMLALDDGGIVRGEHLESAVQREYTKAGGVCPLPRTFVAGR